MADAVPNPQYPTRPPTRPRRSARKPQVSYRRSPGSVSRPVPRVPPGSTSRAARLLGLTRFIPFRAFVDLFFGGVQRNAQLAAAAQQRDLDRYRLTAAERATARLARGAERLVRVSLTPNPLTVAAEVVISPGGARLTRSVPRLVTEPALALQPLNDVVSLSSPDLALNLGQVGAPSRGGAGPGTAPKPAPIFTTSSPFLPLSLPFSFPIESPLLTPFNVPSVSSSPFASPLAFSGPLAEPLAEPEPQRCRCRARKRKAGRPGKGFFRIDDRGRETRRYWLNRAQRK